MVYRDKTDNAIERHKERLGLSGDVYVWGGHFVESLSSHKKLFPNSTAKTIEEAYNERDVYERELREKEVNNGGDE